MKVILFWNPKGYGPVDTCTAVAWDDLTEWVNPLLFTPDSEQLKWLRDYGNPVLNPLLTRSQNVEALAKHLEKWPVPMDSEQFSLIKDVQFNDSINF